MKDRNISNQVNYIETDKNLQSTLQYGTREFPFAYYYDEINRYREHAVEWHWHTGMELSFVISGPVNCFIGNKEILLSSGDVVFINHGVVHRFVSHDGGVMANFIFQSGFISPIGSRIHNDYVLPVLTSSAMYKKIDGQTDEERFILSRLIQAQNEVEIQGIAWELRVSSLIQAAWSRLYRILQSEDFCAAAASKKDNRTYARIRIMLNYIHLHFDENISLEQIADSTNISKSEALRCFRSILDSTPISYLNQYRLSRAEEMLLHGEDSVLEIALKCGFDSSSYFCKVFKKNTGMSPMEFCRKYSDEISVV